MCIKVSLTHKAWCIGSTVHNAFSRDLTRHRKLSASMGNPCAPVLCGAVAALWEVSFYEHCCIRQPQASVVRDLRYVDNRFVHHIAGDDLHWPWCFFFHPFFYRPPLLLDHVDSEDVMGSRINHSNHSIFIPPRRTVFARPALQQRFCQDSGHVPF